MMFVRKRDLEALREELEREFELRELSAEHTLRQMKDIFHSCVGETQELRRQLTELRSLYAAQTGRLTDRLIQMTEARVPSGPQFTQPLYISEEERELRAMKEEGLLNEAELEDRLAELNLADYGFFSSDITHDEF